jgi:lambda repressor-like predicted transcriptional regulator
MTPSSGRPEPLRGQRRQQLAHTLASRFRRGETSIHKLATELGRRPSTVRRLLNEAGIEVGDGPIVGAAEPHLASELARRYHGGASIAALARQTGIDRRAIRRLLVSAGVSLPDRGARPDGMADTLIQRYNQGASIRSLAALAGCSYSTVRTLLLDEGVTLRSRSSSST